MSEKNQAPDSDSSEEVSFGDILYKFLPYWPGIVLLILISLTAAWFYLRYSFPVYQSTASILIKDDKKGGSMDPLEVFDLFGGKKSVENEVEILKSRTLMQEVVKNLHLYAPVSAKGRVVSSSAYLISPIYVEAQDLDSVKKVKEIFFTFHQPTQTVVIDNQKFPVNKFVVTPYGVLKFFPNPNYLPPPKNENYDDIKFSFSIYSVKSIANSYLRILNVFPSSKQSTVVNLAINSQVPKQGEDILNELLKVYNQAAILDKNMLAENTLRFVESRLNFVVKELDSVESNLQQFKARNKIVDISTQGEIYLRTVAENDQKVSEIEMQLAMLDEVQRYVQGQGDLGGMVPATFVADPVLTNLLTNLSDLELKYEQTRKMVPENHPSVIAIVNSIERLKPSILENVKNQKTNLIAAKRNVSGTNEKFSSLLKTIPEKERELLDISRQQTIKSNIYTFLLQKREETALSFASTVADTRIIDKAETADAPVSPKRTIIYLAAFLGALGLSLAIIYIKDVLKRSVQDKSEIEKQTDIPILGDIAFDQSKSPIVIGEGKRSFIAEQFRQLRTSLTYLGVDEQNKRILVTSSISGEGKSFISLNLGVSLSLTNKKVVILELDLRKPKLSEAFKVNRNVGISNYLVGKKELHEIKKETGIANVTLLPSGPIPPNPSELISNGRMEQLLDELEAEYDYIIIDTAPTNPVTDAFLVSPMATVTLYVVRHNYTPRMFLGRLQNFKDTERLKNPAIIYNGVRGKGIEKYGYGTGYGYGYGYTEEKPKGFLRRLFRK